jgi:hypothetical protein
MATLLSEPPQNVGEPPTVAFAAVGSRDNGAGSGEDGLPGGPGGAIYARAVAVLPTLAVAVALCLVTFLASGGLNLGTLTTVEIALTLGCAVAIAATILLGAGSGPVYGQWSAGLLLAFAALAALSVLWSVQPDASWQAASRLFAYSCVFGLAVVLARAAPRGWSAVLGGVLLASVAVCGYALLTKVFPNGLGSEQITYYARLREPYGYWNAIGLAAALGAVSCLWLGARRAGHALLSALAYPAMGVLLVTLMLAYSRGALAALAIGAALWLWAVPLRLRGATVLIVGGVGAAVVVAWDFAQAALTTDSATLQERVTAGHQLGVLLAAMVVVLSAAGLAVGFFSARQPPGMALRRRAGTVLVCLPVVAVLALAGLLTASHRGLFGSVSHGLGALTNPNARVPTNGPGRLTAIGSARARYWHEALQVFSARPLLGAGAEGYATARLRYRTEPLKVQQAHGFAVQTLADVGIVGAALALALLAAWLIAAGRTTHPFNRRWHAWRWRRLDGPATLYTPERVGLLTMLCLVVTFGAHSFVDWTWYVPGLACTALLCAGWLAGRGPLAPANAPPGAPAGSPLVAVAAGTGAGATAEAAAADGATQEGATADGADGAADDATGVRGPVATGRPELADWRGGRRRPTPQALAVAAAVVIAALLAAWAEWQPQRSVDAANRALALAGTNPTAALAAAHSAVARDPLSAEALITLAAVQEGAGEDAGAGATYARAVHLQPANWQTWEALGEYELHVGNAGAALNALRAAVYLNPQAVAPRATINEELLTLQDDYLQALRETSAGGATAAPSGTLSSGSARRSPTASAVLPALRRSRALAQLRSRSRRAG